MAASTRSKQQVKNELTSSIDINDLSPLTQIEKESDDNVKKQSNITAHFTLENWDVYREYEHKKLESIKLLTEVEKLNIDKWLLDLNQIYAELRFPVSRRIWQTLIYLQDEERIWYDQEKSDIKNDWHYFCKKLQQHIDGQLKNNIALSTDHHSLFINDLTQVEKIAPTKCPSIDITSSLSSALSITMAREIIKSPTFFRGAKDDVIEWLEKLEQRFTMANWTDELKLRYISIHLQEDASRWWNQSYIKITTWPCFVEAIKQAFGSTKMKELTFEQLRTYKQALNQSITQYYDQVIELCKRVDTSMTNSMKLQYLMAGVKQSLKLHIALHDPQSPEAFLSYARKLEDTLSLTNTDYDLSQYANHQDTMIDRQQNTSSINSRTDFNTRQSDVQSPQLTTFKSGHMNKFSNKTVSYSSPSKNGLTRKVSGVCYTCGTPGHYSRDCTRSHFH